jgi:hypothetical protein
MMLLLQYAKFSFAVCEKVVAGKEVRTQKVHTHLIC